MRLVPEAALAAVVISILSWTNAAFAAAPKPLFASDELINLTLKGPLTSMSRATDAKPVPGVLTVGTGTAETLPVALSVRGITRRKRDVCSFPPLRVAFTDKPAANSIFKGQGGLKLVVHCQNTDEYQQYVLLEYAAYRLYNALTPESFRVRLAKIDYVAEDGHPIASRFGYFMEDADDVAKRNDQERLRGVNNIASTQLDSAAAARFAVFEYMISNLDWAMTANIPGEDCCHNARLVGAKGSTAPLIPVPYDFDYSGLVDAPYAVPPENIPVANVLTRRYRGFCRDNAQAQAFAADLLTRRTALLAILDGTPQLTDRSRRRADAYLGAFFDQIAASPDIASLTKTCLK